MGAVANFQQTLAHISLLQRVEYINFLCVFFFRKRNGTCSVNSAWQLRYCNVKFLFFFFSFVYFSCLQCSVCEHSHTFFFVSDYRDRKKNFKTVYYVERALAHAKKKKNFEMKFFTSHDFRHLISQKVK
jgi:hypothetical protein